MRWWPALNITAIIALLNAWAIIVAPLLAIDTLVPLHAYIQMCENFNGRFANALNCTSAARSQIAAIYLPLPVRLLVCLLLNSLVAIPHPRATCSIVAFCRCMK